MRTRFPRTACLLGLFLITGRVPAQIDLEPQSADGNEVVESPWVPRDPRADEFLKVEFTPELNSQIPMSLEFMGDDGVRTSLKDRMIPGKPAILALVYYRCPTMCNLVLNSMVDALSEVELTPGEDFAVLGVSFDPTETHVTAAAKKVNALEMYGDPEAAGWHFMVGEEPQIRELTSAANFEYKYDETVNQYSHGSGLLILTPDGRISKFLPDMVYDPNDIRLALVDASEGKIGTLKDKIKLLCYSYNPETGRYGLLINRIIMIACLLTVAAVGWLIYSLIRIDKKQKTQSPPPS